MKDMDDGDDKMMKGGAGNFGARMAALRGKKKGGRGKKRGRGKKSSR